MRDVTALSIGAARLRVRSVQKSRSNIRACEVSDLEAKVRVKVKVKTVPFCAAKCQGQKDWTSRRDLRVIRRVFPEPS